MKNLKSHKFGLRVSRGFSIVELLIALAITALIVTAVAAAFSASVTNFHITDDSFKALNKARMTLTLITPQIRTARAVNPLAPSNQCDFVSADGQNISYRFEPSLHKLFLDKNSTSYLLCDNVVSMTFEKNTGGGSNVKSVLISMTVSAGSARQALSTAVTVRKEL